MGKDGIEVFAALVNHCGKADDLRPCADDDEKLEFAVVLLVYIAVFRFVVHHFILTINILNFTANLII